MIFMTWKKEITQNAKFLLKKGFEITTIKDAGMGKIAKLSTPGFTIVFIYDKGPVHCDVENKYGSVELVYLANFVNNRSQVYDIPMFYWKDGESNDQYIQFFDRIMENEYEKITTLLSHIEKDVFDELVKYQNQEKKRDRGW